MKSTINPEIKEPALAIIALPFFACSLTNSSCCFGEMPTVFCMLFSTCLIILFNLLWISPASAERSVICQLISQMIPDNSAKKIRMQKMMDKALGIFLLWNQRLNGRKSIDNKPAKQTGTKNGLA